ncbi:transposase [Flavobacterium azizsancarii]|uniref:transposase n=1 Tax=Flavobacterium azizsancarii TaxID=2961580 RepID=UPI0039C8A367
MDITSKKRGQYIYSKSFANGDSVKQFLARSRYVLYKSHEKWTESHNERSQILFSLYPDIKTAHRLIQQLRGIYNNYNNKHIAMTKLAHWYRNVEEPDFKNFNILLNTKTLNY